MIPRSTIRAAFLLAAVIVVSLPTGAQTPAPFGTTVEVKRILTEVRVVDDAGHPITGLGPEDFRVKIRGKRAEVESVAWIPTASEAAAMAATPTDAIIPSGAILSAPSPRLIVVLFQTDIGGYRIDGLMRMAPYAADFVRNLAPTDRVALLTFESHLQMRSDFTVDHEALTKMITTTEILEGTIQHPKPSSPGLSEHFDVGQARKAANLTRALELVGQALTPIPGPKTLVLFGWGLGRYNRSHRIARPGYSDAVAALAAARTSVFSVDITTADWHTLEIGLRNVSDDTGGIYFKTHLFPEIAMDKLVRVISSYYELSIVPPPKFKHPYQIDVRVKRRGAMVYVRQNHPTGR